MVHRSARPLDYTKWKFLFEDGSCDDFLSVLSSYQNEDGGFGYNIECNNWNPNSSPYTVCIALDYLDIAGKHESDIKSKIIAGIVKYLRPCNISVLAAAAGVFCRFAGKQLLSGGQTHCGHESGHNH